MFTERTGVGQIEDIKAEQHPDNAYFYQTLNANNLNLKLSFQDATHTPRCLAMQS